MRILNNEDKGKLAKEYPLLDFSFEDDYREEVEIILQAQHQLDLKDIIGELESLLAFKQIGYLIKSLKQLVEK